VKSGGALRIWNGPHPHTAYVIGADVAKGLAHGDFSSAHVINMATGMVDAAWHGHIDPEQYGIELAALGWYYNCALVGVEVNNHGLTTVTALKNARYPRQYRRRKFGSRNEVVGHDLGWYTSSSTKPMMMDELSSALKHDEIRVADRSTVEELLTYSRDENGKLSGRPWDDRVISLAIANQMRKFAFSPETTPEAPPPAWTIDWAVGLLEQDTKPKRLVIGANNVRSGPSR
jgi:hypothetical protein